MRRLLFLLVVGCSSYGGDEISVEVDPPGAVVAWYEPEADTTLDSLSARHPEFYLPALLSFDHRLFPPLRVLRSRRTLRTEPPDDSSLLVVHKDGFGWRYLMPDGDVIISLHREEEIGGELQKDTDLGEYGHYIVRGGLVVPQGISLRLGKGTWMRFEEGCALEVRGHLEASGSSEAPIAFTWEEGKWAGLKFSGGTGEIRWARISGAVQGIYLDRGARVGIDKVLVEDGEVGISVGGAKLDIRDSWVRLCGTGILAEVDGEVDILRSAVFRCQDYGLWTKLKGSIKISDSALISDGVCARGERNGTLAIEHCEIEGRRGIEVDSGALKLVASSVEAEDVAVYLSRPNIDEISGNNISGARWLVYLFRTGDVDLPGNWWGTDDADEISRRMRDGNDIPPGAGKDWAGEVRFRPFSREPFKDAGIRGMDEI